jgi:hypothetical protein
MASNTQIFIKRSEANSAPGSLRAGELAYSYASNTLFIGANTATGPGYLKIGGQFYTNVIDSATYSNTVNTLVLRDGNGDFAAGNVTAAYFIGDGSALSNIPSQLNITGDTGSNAIHMLTETLNFAGGEGITSTVTGDQVTFDVDNTVFRANSGLSGAVQFVDSPVVFSGNVQFTGNTFYNDVTTLNIADPIIYLASNNYTGDAVDIGFAANYFDGTNSRHTGLFRHNSDKHYYLFQNYLPEPGDSNIIDPTDASFEVAYLHAELKGNVTAHNVSGNVTANTVTSNSFRAFGGTPDGENGYSFVGDGGYDTGMFSPADGELEFWSNDSRIITANSTSVFFEQDLKLKNAAKINNPTGLLELNPDETNEDDRYIVIDPTAPNHIHLRAGGAIDASGADLFLGGEQNYVRVSDGSANVEIRTNDTHAFQFTDQGKFQLANGTSIYDSADGFFVDPIRANNAIGGNVTAYNTTTKELVSTDVKITNAGITLANGTTISDGESGFFVDSLSYDAAPLDQANIVLYNATTGEITYGPIADLNPAQLANGSHNWTVSADTGALYSNQGTSLASSANSVVLGTDVDVTNANSGRVAIGWYAGSISQSQDSIAIGNSAGQSSQDISAVAIGNGAGYSDQSFSAVAVGRWAGQTSQGWDSVAVGRRAGRAYQGSYSVAMGWGAGVDYQGPHSVAIGEAAGAGHQSAYAVAIGSGAGNTSQGWGATAIGTNAGIDTQGLVAVAIGSNAGRYTQSQGAVAVGRRAGESTQGYYSVAMGNRAGRSNQGDYSIAIGSYAGDTNQSDNSIILNASGSTLNATTSGFFVNPIAYNETQDATYDGIMFYNTNSKEVRYSYALDGGVF